MKAGGEPDELLAVWPCMVRRVGLDDAPAVQIGMINPSPAASKMLRYRSLLLPGDGRSFGFTMGLPEELFRPAILRPVFQNGLSSVLVLAPGPVGVGIEMPPVLVRG
jgi:hypothetical protein